MFESFTAPQLATLRALVNRIIPADEFPGGWEGGVEGYLRRQFAGDLRPFGETYRAALDALDAEARAAGGPFVALSPAEQDRLLARVEQGDVATPWAVDPAAFFRMAVAHVAEGYYSDPGNGGNRNGAAWRMIGFEVRG
jgi:hypothetical protein